MANVKVRSKRNKSDSLDSAYSYQFEALGAEELMELFPSPRYFQIHFSHVHENAEQVQNRLNDIARSVERLETRLEQLMASMEQ